MRGEDDYDFESVGQGIRSIPNRARRNVNFRGMGNYEDVDKDLDSIKLKIPNFQGKNDSICSGRKMWIRFLNVVVIQRRGRRNW
jgi:hypothetical protein